MIRILVFGCSHMETKRKMIEALRVMDDVTVEFAPESSSRINENIVMEIESKISGTLRISVQKIRQFKESLLQVSKERDTTHMTKRKFPIPVQCQRAAKIQKTWIRRK